MLSLQPVQCLPPSTNLPFLPVLQCSPFLIPSLGWFLDNRIIYLGLCCHLLPAFLFLFFYIFLCSWSSLFLAHLLFFHCAFVAVVPLFLPVMAGVALAVEIKVIKDLPWPPPVGQLNSTPTVVEELESPAQTAQAPPGQTCCDQHHHGGCCAHIFLYHSHLPVTPRPCQSINRRCTIHHLSRWCDMSGK